MLFQVSASWNIHSLPLGMEWGIPSTRGGHGMSFPDRSPRAVMKFFQPEAGGRGLEKFITARGLRSGKLFYARLWSMEYYSN